MIKAQIEIMIPAHTQQATITVANANELQALVDGVIIARLETNESHQPVSDYPIDLITPGVKIHYMEEV